MAVAVRREVEQGVERLTVALGGVEVSYLSGRIAGPDVVPLMERFAAVLPSDGHVVSHLIVAPRSQHESAMQALAQSAGAVSWPVTWIDEGGGGAGVQACVVSGAPVRYLQREGRTVGALWEDEHAHHCWLGDITAADPSAPREAQARATFEAIEQVLAEVGMGFEHVVRTWLFIDRMLDWYGPFNAVRTEFFEQRGVFDRFLPASTGIGAANAAGRAVVAQVIALRPKGTGVEVREVESPLQCPATDYRSSFSRAAEVVRGGVRQVYVSGTASIDPCGETVHEDDLERQIGHTMEVVAAILETHGLGWVNVSRGIVYFRHGQEAARFERYCRERHLPPLPVIVTQGTICRDDLLFEIEVDAIGP